MVQQAHKQCYSISPDTTRGVTENFPGIVPGTPSGQSLDKCELNFVLNPGKLERERNMEVSEIILCPICGQRFALTIDTSVPTQRFTTDCEVCCRPFEVLAECEPGEVLSLNVVGSDVL